MHIFACSTYMNKLFCVKDLTNSPHFSWKLCNFAWCRIAKSNHIQIRTNNFTAYDAYKKRCVRKFHSHSHKSKSWNKESKSIEIAADLGNRSPRQSTLRDSGCERVGRRLVLAKVLQAIPLSIYREICFLESSESINPLISQ